MGSILQEIQLVHSLRKNIRDPKLPSTILASIESIQRCLKTGIDQNGWKTVEWRGSRAPQNHAPHSNQKGYTYGSRAQHSQHSQHVTHHREATPSNASFSQRVRAPEPVTSILTSNPASNHTSNPASIPLTTIHPHVSQKGNGAWHDSSDGFRPHQKYVSKFKKTTGKVEDTILNTILLGKLNKFSQPNYIEIKEFMLDSHYVVPNLDIADDVSGAILNVMYDSDSLREEMNNVVYDVMSNEIDITGIDDLYYQVRFYITKIDGFEVSAKWGNHYDLEDGMFL